MEVDRKDQEFLLKAWNQCNRRKNEEIQHLTALTEKQGNEIQHLTETHAREIEEQEKIQSELKSQIVQLEEELNGFRSNSRDSSMEMDRLRKEINTLKIKYNEKELKLKEAAKEIKQLKAEIRDTKAELGKISNEKEKLVQLTRDQINDLTGALDKTTKEKAKAEAKNPSKMLRGMGLGVLAMALFSQIFIARKLKKSAICQKAT